MARTGVLLINTGTPDAPTEDAIRRYLAEMLSDPMLISIPPLVWNRVLKHAILPKRPAQTKPSYEHIWTPDGSKFMVVSRAQRNALQDRMGNEFEVVLSMRYGNPSIASGLAALRAADCETVVAVPLYPQYAKVCAGTCLKEVHRCLAQAADDGWKPRLVEVRQFYDQPTYINALTHSICEAWQHRRSDGFSPGKLLLSWHSTMLADIKAGDPYHSQNELTASAVAHELGLADDTWGICYQSRFDNRKWLSPFIENQLQQLALQGVKNVTVVCPGFVADNIETLVEIDVKLRRKFLDAAGEGATFTYVPALNDNPGLIQALASAIYQAL